MFHKSIIQTIRCYNVNPVIKFLILSDFLVWSSAQLFAPIFAIFIIDNLVGGEIEAVGLATAIFLIVKSIFEIPVGVFIDRTKSEKDDLYAVVMGTAMMGVVFLFYSQISSVSELYVLQVLLGFSAAISYPGWCSIFTKHIDKQKEAFEWSLYDVFIGVGMAGASAVGGFLVNIYGFSLIFYIAAACNIFGSVLLLSIRNRIK